VRAVRDMVASGLFGVALGVAVVRTLHSTPPAHSAELPDAVAHEVYLETTDREADGRRDAAFRFQGSLWSQQDEFFAKQTSFVKRFAIDHRVSVGGILFALDRGMRERWPTHPDVVISPKVVPCRPRLAYH
jgi:hypothetical protein